MISDRANQIGVSATMGISAEVNMLESQGLDVINLGVGELDYSTPFNIKEAGIKAINKDKTRYTTVAGTLELRNAIALKLKQENNLEYNLNEIIVTNGAKQSLFNAVMTLVNPGDEVIIPLPYWVSYPSMVSMAQGRTVYIPTTLKNGFKITGKQFEAAITSKSKLLILCNPSNPTGSVYNKNDLTELAEVIQKYNLYVITDEIYEKIIYDDISFYSFAEACPTIKDRIILVNGLSKSYSMTGWRIGYAAANENIINGMNKIQSHSTSHASTISQEAAIEALSGSQNINENIISELKARREYLYNELTSIIDIKCYKPQGAFYLFPDISSLLQKNSRLKTSYDFAMHLLRSAHVAVVPGSGFGMERFLRISYAVSMDNLKEAVNRFKRMLKDLDIFT